MNLLMIISNMKIFVTPMLAISFVSLTSCDDDPQLIQKRESQRTEIARLEGELNVIHERIKNAPSDKSSELEKIKTSHQEELRKIKKLETEIEILETEKRDLEHKLKTYMEKYPLR